MDHDREKYLRYLQTREWAVRKCDVINRSGGMCERCKRRPMKHVHHLTYARLFNELLTDLQALCKGCHQFVHGKSDKDPAKQEGFEAPQIFRPMPQPSGTQASQAVRALLAAGRAESDAELMAKYRPAPVAARGHRRD